jgi:TDG/mug DNA glycosylase family protein
MRRERPTPGSVPAGTLAAVYDGRMRPPSSLSDAPSPMPAGRALPLLLRPGLRLVFIGFNPGLESARRGHYYAFRGNVFWKHLNESGIVPRPVGFEDDRALMDDARIGFTDLCTHATLRADELTLPEVIAGAARLHAELREHQPGIAVFSGKGIYQLFGRHALGLPPHELARRPLGEQPERIGATVPWVIPSSSGLAARYHTRRLELLRELAAQVPADEWGAAGCG